MIKQHSTCYSIGRMCHLLGVSSSGYYDWLGRKPSARKQANIELTQQIKTIFDQEKSRPGAMRIYQRLKAQGHTVGRHRIARLMRENQWRARAAKKYKATTNSNHRLPVAPNLLQQNFEATKPDEKWVSDITYSVPGVLQQHGSLKRTTNLFEILLQ